jgi:NAD-dependent deacetylase
MTQSAQHLLQWLDEADRVVAFTGAGISTESGIPDFRSPGGLWTKNQPIPFKEFVASEEVRIESWRRKAAIDPSIAAARPSCGHRVLASLVGQGKVTHVITQNIDNLHQLAGTPDDKVIELHGNGRYAACLECGERHELDWVFAQLEQSERPPDCTACGGLIKSATISFGQPMPEAAMQEARAAALSADLFLAIGSSLQVYPAAGFPILAKQNGARLIIVNREPTPLDELADLVIHGEIGEVMAGLDGARN